MANMQQDSMPELENVGWEAANPEIRKAVVKSGR